MTRPDIKTMEPARLREWMTAAGYPAYRARQVEDWLNKGVSSFDGMKNLPAALTAALADAFVIGGVTVARRWESRLDDTVKYLLRLSDGETVESVLMHYKYGWSQCLSTQVGCRMGCAFCATGMGGFVRNLTAAEMLSQIEAAQSDRGIRVSSVVLMGMGEPLDNFDEVTAFLDALGREGGVHIGMRHVSLSTCGLVDKIDALREQKRQLTLSVSLHAPNNEIRDRLMPVNRRWPIETLLASCRRYADETGRRISFEYAMMAGVNDSDAAAAQLASRLKGMLCHVNLIPANAVEGKSHKASPRARLAAFQEILKKEGINVTVRRTLGADIEASCGQLRRQADREGRN